MGLNGGWPSGPSGSVLFGSLREFRQDRLGFLSRLARDYGDFVPFRLRRQPVVLINDPKQIEIVVSKRAGDYSKNFLAGFFHPAIRKHLLFSEPESWLEQRRLAQPALRPDRMAAYSEVMVAQAERMCDAWRDGECIETASLMRRLTLDVLSRSLFDVELAEMAAETPAIVDAVLDDVSARAFASFYMPIIFPSVSNQRFWARVRQGNRMLDELIASRRESADGRRDLLSLLVKPGPNGRQLTDQEVKLAAVPLLFAGHETTAMALTWTLYLVSMHPGVEGKLVSELDRVIGSRRATMEDMDRLPYTAGVLHESLRLYPPIWGFGRQAVRETELGEFRIPAGTILFASQWVLHRDERHFKAPMEFDPDRWSGGSLAGLPRCAYMPFGVGPRRCLGSTFALLEAILVLATLYRRFRFAPAGDGEPVLEPLITLRPKSGLRLVARQRS